MSIWIDFDGIINARDLGGIPAADGKKVKPGRLLRGAGLQKASDADLLRLEKDYHLKHIVDFRFSDECDRSPDRPVPGAEYHNMPALVRSGDRRMPGPGADQSGEPDFDAVYRMVYARLAELEHTAQTYRKFFDILLSTTEGAVYFHCTQGKDRTGMAAILTLTALGADWADAEADYFLSNVGLECMVENPGDPRSVNWSRKTKEALTYVFAENLAVYTDSVKRNWGSLDNYIRQRIGLTEAEIIRLREMYLE